MKRFLGTILAAFSLSVTVQAETLIFEATDDFENISNGEVPYYKHNSRSALAINASIEAFRDKFARATTTYSGKGGIYDVTVSALGEIDGECEYRFLVNGVVVATATNNRVTEDYGVQDHIFEDIAIPANAEISVESNAVTNGLVPEGDITAFARGRWTTLKLDLDEAAVADTIDLALSSDVDNYDPQAGQHLTLSYEVFNENPLLTATSPNIQITLPSQVTLAPQSQCTVSGTEVNCPLAEIGPKQGLIFTLPAIATGNGEGQLTATISADQQDNNTSNNTSTTLIDVTAVALAPAPTVDLSIVVTSDSNTAQAGDTVSYSMTVVNQHQSNVATSPVIGVLLPGGMDFSTSNACSANGRSVTCSLQELPPGESTTVSFTGITSVPGTATVIASISAAQTDDVISDNEVLYSITVTENTDAPEPSRNIAVDNSVSSGENTGGNGGGSLSLGILLLLGVSRRCYEKRRPQLVS